MQAHGNRVVMNLEIIDTVSSGAGRVNEDRAGAHGALCWVIDGATDVIASPIAGETSDASWLAEEIERGLRLEAASAVASLSEIPAHLAGGLAQSFARVQRRAPVGREEHPSASGVIVRLKDGVLEYMSLGDCAIIAEGPNGLLTLGVDDNTAGDIWVRSMLESDRRANPELTQAKLRENLWPKLRALRAAMNKPDGYGVFSITPPPPQFVRSGSIALEPGSAILLASDGLTRLVDVFCRYDAQGLIKAARTRGIGSLITELRQIEMADCECISFPRAKISDDATGLLARVAER